MNNKIKTVGQNECDGRILLLSPYLLSIDLWSGSRNFPEKAYEVGMVAEPECVCHLHHGLLFGEQQQLRFFDFLAVDILQRRDSRLIFEKSDEVGLRYAGEGGEIV